MCVFCEKYAEGHESWLLNPNNYARRIYKVGKKEETGYDREQRIKPGGMWSVDRSYYEALERGDLESVNQRKKKFEDEARVNHITQVISLQELLQAVDLMYPIAVSTCICRRSMQALANENNFTCIAMGPGMYKWERWPDGYRGGVQFLGPDEAKDLLSELDKRGLVHLMATFGTPYLGGLCNCGYPDCAALRAVLDLDLKVVYKGHYVAVVEREKCNGCGLCSKRCQFHALNYNATNRKIYINPRQCFGCGLCATECRKGAISMVKRAALPALKDVW